jgi:transposase-like protein
MKEVGERRQRSKLHQFKYLTNVVEQDHRRVERLA